MKRNRLHSQDYLHPVIENIIMVAIILVIAHTFIEELAIVYHWSNDAFRRIDIAAFFFDLLFTAEFAARSLIAVRHKAFKRYFLQERGWVDALTSVPLLFLVSGPAVTVHLLGGDLTGHSMEFLHILKTAKAIRVARILRLIRVVKLFGKIQNAESLMTNRHTGAVSVIGVMAMITVLVLSQFVSFMAIGDHKVYWEQRSRELVSSVNFISDSSRGSGDQIALTDEAITEYIKGNPRNDDVVRLYNGEGTKIYEHPDARNMTRTLYRKKKAELPGGYTAELSFHIAEGEHAKINIIALFSIVMFISFMLLFYARIFAQHVSDPVYIMNRGLREWDYNLEVRIHPDFSSEEIYRLAYAYNQRWLPLKNKLKRFRQNEGSEKSTIKMEDII